jgi:epoxyqueuosine reductase
LTPRAALPVDLARAAAAFADIGCGEWGVADAEAGSVVVFASTGRRLWSLARARGGPDPIDGIVRDVIAALPVRPDRRWVRCADDVADAPDFRALARAAGLGWPSRLGLLIHPTFGSWIGLRAAVFVPERLAATGPLAGDGPCARCPAPCVSACPAAAIADTWDPSRCLPWQAAADTCHSGCLARGACPVGADHAYAPDQHRYHHHPPSRPALLGGQP